MTHLYDGEISLVCCLKKNYANSNADFACYRNKGNIDTSGCNGLAACLENEGNIGENSCSTTEKFQDDTDDFPDDFQGACVFNNATIGESSCKEQGSCLGNKQEIGNSSCLGYHACIENEGLIGDESWYVLILPCDISTLLICISHFYFIMSALP